MAHERETRDGTAAEPTRAAAGGAPLTSARAAEHRGLARVLSHYTAGTILVLDPALRVVLAEGRGLAAAGETRDALVGRALPDVVAPARRAHVTARLAAALAGDEQEFVVELDERTLRVTASPLHDDDGRIEGVLVLTVDITTERRATAQLRLLENAVAHLHDMVLITEASPLHEPGPRIVFVNDAFLRRTGYTRAQVLGRSPRLLQGPGTAPEATRAMAIALARQEAVRVELVNYTAAGEPYWLDLQIAPVTDDTGTVTHYVSVQRDITERKEAEARERAAAERLAHAIDGAQDGLRDWQVATGETYFSPSWARMLGYEPGEVAPHITTWTDLAHPDDLPRAMAALDEHFSGRCDQYECEHRMRRKDGTWAWILDRGKVVERAPDGAPLRMVGTHADISERKRLEEALRTMAEASASPSGSEAFLGDLVQRLAQALGVRMAWIAENDATHGRMLAVVRDGGAIPPMRYELAGTACAAVVANAAEFHMPVGVAEAFPAAAAAMGFRAESYLGVPLFGDGGAQRGMLCLLHDAPLPASPALSSMVATFAARAAGELARRRAELMLRERTADLERAQRIARVGGWRWDPATGANEWSEEQYRIHGQSPDAFVPTYEGWVTIVHPDDRDAVQATLARAIADRRPDVAYEFRIVRPDGAIAHVATRAELAYDADGRCVACIGTDQDVTERRSLEAQLRQSQKMEAIGLLAGGVAHDFNNLLTVIRGNADFLLSELEDRWQSWADAEEIRAAADRAAGLTRQLLAFSRRQVMQARVIDVDDTVRGIEKLLRRVIGEDIALTVRTEAAGAPVLADPGQVEQVLLNLAVNARDAMPEGGALVVATARAPLDALPPHRRIDAPHGVVLLSVRDTGVGMDEATASRAFEPFFTTKGAGHGTGLGLATVFGIVEQSGGTVWMESAPGRGTAVVVALPVTDAVPTPAPRAAPADGPTGEGLIMVVEDDDAVRSLARRTLVRAGYAVVEARTGREALRHWEDAGAPLPQALVTDVVMPDMGGVALAHALRERHPSLPVLFLSGYARTADGTSPLDLGGAVEFVEKPFATEALLGALATLLQGAGAR